jgi:hypothetical protein
MLREKFPNFVGLRFASVVALRGSVHARGDSDEPSLSFRQLKSCFEVELRNFRRDRVTKPPQRITRPAKQIGTAASCLVSITMFKGEFDANEDHEFQLDCGGAGYSCHHNVVRRKRTATRRKTSSRRASGMGA